MTSPRILLPASVGPRTAVATALLAAVAAVASALGGASWGAAGGNPLAAPPVATAADPAPCPVRWLLASGRLRLPRGLRDPDNAVHEE